MFPSPAVSTRPAVAAAFPVCADFAAFGMIPEFATFVSICIPMRKPPPIRLSKKVHRKLIFSLLLLLAAAVVVSRCMVSRTGGAVSVMPVLPPAEKADGMPSVPGRMPDPQRPCAGLELPACSRGEFLIRNEAGRYTLLYDTAYRQAAWVAYLLTREDVRRRGARRRNAFRCDPEVVARGWPTAGDRDYAGSSFDRGHLLPSADRDDSRAENDATFYLSNVSPQYPKLNRNQWRLLEEQVRRWADRYDSIYVVTGGELEPGLRRIRGGTGIPRHYFKALLARAEKGWRAIAFRLPNVASPEGRWTDYSLSVDRLEELTGIDFFPALPDSIERRVESRVDAGFWK